MTPQGPPKRLADGRFEVLRALGEGSFGVVYEAHDHARDERVALKVLARVDASAIHRFKREFRALSDFRHPHVVRLRELLSDGRTWLLAMDLVPGVDLRAWLSGAAAATARAPDATATATAAATLPATASSSSPLRAAPSAVAHPLDAVRAVFGQLARGVAALHDAGWLHRDLKPSNAMVTPEGRAVLLDFGLLARAHRGTADSREDGVVGTPTYMSPEQALHEPATTASDWYSFGVMLFEALTGAPPFRGSAFQVMHARCTTDAPDPRTRRPDLPDDLAALTLALLARDASKRPAASVVLRALGADPGASPRSAPIPFAGRTRELDALAAHARSAVDRPVLVHVTGPAGVGRSALLRALAARLRADGALVLESPCHARELVPFNALDAAADGLARRLRQRDAPDAVRATATMARLFPALGRDDPGALRDEAPASRRDAFDAFRRALAWLAEREPVALLVDDAQWGDADSAALLADLVAPPRAPPVVVVLAGRDEGDALGEMLSALRDAWGRGAIARPTPLALGPLGDDVLLALARAVAPDASDGDLRWAAATSAGSPRAVVELARALREGIRPAPTVTPAEALAARVERTSPDARSLLAALSLAERPLAERLARDAAGLDAARFDVARAALLDAALVRADGAAPSTTLALAHDAVREAVARRCDLDAARAPLLAALGRTPDAPADLTASLLHAAGDPRAAVPFDLAAGDALAHVAFDRAASLYARALPWAEGDVRAGVGARLAATLDRAGRPLDAARTLHALARSLPGERGALVAARAGLLFLRAGRAPEGLDTLLEALDGLGFELPSTPGGALPDVDSVDDAAEASLGPRLDVATDAAVVLSTLDPVLAARVSDAGLARSPGGGPARAGAALAVAALLAAEEGVLPEATIERAVAQAEALAWSSGDRRALGWSVAAAAADANGRGRWRQGARLGAYAAGFFVRDGGDSWESALLDARWTLPSRVWSGDLGALLPRARELARVAEARGDRGMRAIVGAGSLVWGLLARDAPDEARAAVDGAPAEAPLLALRCSLARAAVALYEGDWGGAGGLVDAAWRAARGGGLDRLRVVRVERAWLGGVAALGARADGEVRAAADALRAEDLPWTDALAEALGALAAGAPRGEIAATFEALDMPLQAALFRGDDAALTAAGVAAPARWARLFRADL